MKNYSAISRREQINFLFDDNGVRYVLEQHPLFDVYRASSLKQQSECRHVA
jgi:hypothetical protein